MTAHLIVRILLEDRLDEIVGAANFWVDADGRAHNAGTGHVEWAAKMLNMRLSSASLGSDYWTVQGRVYQEMFKRGWMRVAVLHAQKEMLIDFRRQTKAQMHWAEMKAIEDGLRITDDRGRTIADYTQPLDSQE